MHEGTLRVEQVELVVEAAPRARDGSRVAQHAQAARHLGQVATRDVRRRLVADTELEAGRAPIDELDSAFGLDDGNSSVDVLGYDISTVEKSASHYDIFR